MQKKLGYNPQTAKFLAVIAQNMPGISADVMQGWIENPKGLKKVLAGALCPPKTIRNGREQAEAVNTILCLRSGNEVITIAPCDGTQTLAQSKKTFLSYIDADFKNLGLDKVGKATEETAVQAYEMAKDATFAKMFGSLGSDLNKLCLTQHQIKVFCENHSIWLRTGGNANFFLFKENEQFFVAGVHTDSDGLNVCVYRFEDARVWDAGRQHRLVSPQLVA